MDRASPRPANADPPAAPVTPALPAGGPTPYHAWLLRCWQEHVSAPAAEPAGWRFSLEDPHTGRRRGFAGLAALIAFLETALAGDGHNAGAASPERGPPVRGP